MEGLEHLIHTIATGPLEYQFSWLLSLALPFALIKGRWVERVIAAGTMAGFYAAGLIRAGHPDLHQVMNAIVVADVCIFAFVLPFALWSDRYWPMWLLGCWTMMVLIDFVVIIQPHPNLNVFNNSSALWSDAAMIIIGVGTYIEGMRRPKTKLPRLQLVGPT